MVFAAADGPLVAELRLPAAKNLLPVAQAFAESSASSFGLDSKAALSLALAAEEIFMHLCACLPQGSPLDLRSDGRGGRAALEFRFPAGAAIDLSPFNICSSCAAGGDDLSEARFQAMGLLLAARSVDSLSLREEPGDIFSLHLAKERSYPKPALPAVALRESSGSWNLRPPLPEELPVAAALLEAAGADAPSALLVPAKTAALLESGLLSMLLAVQSDGSICGLAAWSRIEPGRALECFGPYPLTAKGSFAKEIAASLLDALIASICKSDAPVLIARRLRPEFAKAHFEPLPGSGGTAFFRLLEDDEGSMLWLSPTIAPYVRKACSELFLPRSFAEADASARSIATRSVFFTTLDRKESSAIMRPLRFGLDLAESLKAHLATLQGEGFKKISCELDLGVSWHPLLAESLLAAGFQPGTFLPLAGEGDLLYMDFV